MKKFFEIKSHLADNTGDENVSKLIWIVIVFVVGAILLTTLRTAFDSGTIGAWLTGSLQSWFGTAEVRPAA